MHKQKRHFSNRNSHKTGRCFQIGFSEARPLRFREPALTISFSFFFHLNICSISKYWENGNRRGVCMPKKLGRHQWLHHLKVSEWTKVKEKHLSSSFHWRRERGQVMPFCPQRCRVGLHPSGRGFPWDLLCFQEVTNKTNRPVFEAQGCHLKT